MRRSLVHCCVILYSTGEAFIGFYSISSPKPVKAAITSLENRSSYRDYSSLPTKETMKTSNFLGFCNNANISGQDDEHGPADLPIEMAASMSHRSAVMLHQLLDCDHHLLPRILPLRKVSRPVLGAHISTVCSTSCISRRFSFRCDALS